MKFDAQNALSRRLRLIADIDAEDEAAVRALPVTHREVDDGVDIVTEGETVRQCCILIDGFTCRYRHTLEGKRQIIAFHVPGDIPDLHSLHINQMDHSFAAMTRCRIGFVPHEAVWSLCLKRPNVAAALWLETLIDGAIFREWIVGLGRLSGASRTAHLLCELAMRIRSVGLAPDNVYRLPLTQNELADALGLTVVTVNRVLRDFKLAGLIDRSRSRLEIKDWNRLAELGEFDPKYLHFRSPIATTGIARQ
ncbi:Crp/Fnr family transcriptional regulator [Aurantimonas sp. VKM B-3413]|uniref:Crp/Fnr family transcriptional regulator n=1 Tax=Aurantimonas sp. VKM B-3413 TaxID=2779401 RepID=UPI001E505BBC|nr:Crp/Fnr family transcriptional regulator [Aurantimonas sp. VKM B-3413]MCB8839291.1 Crp/Fnr family transcriptional regulator [Aurantimonas sp. VKM B-3413]